MQEISDKMIRLAVVKLAAQLQRPDEPSGNLLVTAAELYRYIRYGKGPELNLPEED